MFRPTIFRLEKSYKIRLIRPPQPLINTGLSQHIFFFYKRKIKKRAAGAGAEKVNKKIRAKENREKATAGEKDNKKRTTDTPQPYVPALSLQTQGYLQSFHSYVRHHKD